MGGQGRKPIIPHVSPKRYRKRCALPKPLPLGEVSPKVTERASPAGKSRGRSDRQALCQSDTIAVSELFGSSLALSVGLAPASSPRGGAIGMSVSFRLDERSTMSRKQQCSAVQASGSLTRSVVQKPLPPQARPALLRHIGPQSSSGKLSGLPRALPLGELARSA